MPPHGTGSGTETTTTTSTSSSTTAVFSSFDDGRRSRNVIIKNFTDRRRRRLGHGFRDDDDGVVVVGGGGGAFGGVRKGRTGPDRTVLLTVVLVLLLSFCDGCKAIKDRKHGLGRARLVPNVSVSNQHSYHHHQMRSRPVAAMGKEEDYIAKGKICIGTHGRMSVPSNRDHHYRNMKDRYTNCTYVDGNLELSWLQDPTKDLDFAKDIREVTGYVQISHVDVKRIVLPNLQIIRGRTRFKMNPPDEDEYALIITLNKVESVELPALREIQNGSVGIINNYNLCHIRQIDWKEIISDPRAVATYVYNFTSSERECSPCHKSCMRGCWGDGPDNCQKFSKVTCSPQCAGGRCYGPEPRQCCHLFCAGGCTGPTQNECIACKNFYDDGVCTSECPPMRIYDPATYSWKDNPNGKYAYGATCVKKCPEHLLKDNGACVRVCPPNKKAQDGECVLCDGPCPKSCVGDTTVHSGNIDSFRGCTVIEGYLNILENSFKGFQQVYPNYTFGDRYPEMHPDRLEVFSTLKELTGYLNIQAYDKNFRNLSYFRNLEIIHGRVLHEYSSSLYIVKSSLESLELKSLRKINMGTVVILENKDMCFAEDINWEKLRKSHEHSLMLSNNSDPKSCKNKGLVCDSQCSRDGCWGPGPDQCLSCAHFKLGNRCLLNCSVENGIYRADDYECKPCHPQCGLACNGPGATNCTTCKNFKDGPFCVEKCPDGKYEENGVCRKCHANCVDGCTGPKNTIGPGGCNSCALAIMSENATVDVCLNENETCPEGYYFEYVGPQVQEERALKSLSGKAICRKCHPRCKKCIGYGFHELICQRCAKYKKGEQCEDECPQDHYPDIATHICIACDPECRGCSGPGPDNCLVCQNFKLYDNGNIEQNNTFRCVSVCPPDFPHRMFPENEALCSNVPVISAIVTPKNSTYVVVIAVGSVGAVVALLVFTVLIYCQRKEKLKANAMKMTMAMALNNIEDNEPLRPSNIPPNTAHLRIINETELRRGNTLGYGAFGVVYKGFWMLDGERQHKIPVAIKVLRKDATMNNSKEFLSEAHIMASIDHPNLLKLLAVCMTSENMLITQLMGLGCLLDFVRKKKDDIGSQTMLSWCTQIARGMAYLEEKRLVHRDLAARNVLVQNANCVKITDFGLAKLLDTNEEEYKAAGGKMPIKWLALECIQHRRFTHKSDVWAFGVTVWEILTFGERPYPKTPAREVPELLEKGERLPQPEIATIDVYMIMIKCWMLESESRPCFKELEDDFSKMSLDPGRYLIIPGDRYLKVPAGMNTLMSDREMVRSLASENVDISESDDYLHRPKSRVPFHGTGLTSLSGVISGSPIPDKYCRSSQPVVSDGSSAYPNSQNQFNHRLMSRYNQRHQDPNVHGTQSDVSSAKYCGADEIGSDEYDSSDRPKLVQVVTLKLPVDEDDYLIPSPQHSQGPSTYLDLNKTTDHNASNPNVFQNYSELFQNNIDNPEYLLNNEAPLPPTQTVGLPDVSNFTVPPSPSGGVADTSKGSFALPRSSEEESDHECYDFDRLKRELQPLQKNKDGAIV